MKKINILHIIDYLESTGGAEKRLLSDLSLINPKVFDNHVVCLFSANKEITDNLNDKNIKVFLLAEKKNLLKKFLCLRKIVSELNPDIVHTQLFFSDVLGRTAAKICKVPVTISTFQNSVHEPSVPYYYSRIRRFLDLITARFCTRFIAVSEFVKKSVSKRLFITPEKINVIYNYLEIPEVKLRNTKSKETILCCVGKLNPAKGQKELIEAINKLIKEGGRLKLLLVGDSPLRKNYEKLVKKLNIEKNVVMLGNVNNVFEILSDSDAFIFPTHSEGLSLSLLEAVLSKKPCVISSIPPNLEVISKNNCFVFEPKSSKAICSAIQQYLRTDSKDLKKMVEQAYKEAIKKFQPELQVKKLEKLYYLLYKEKQDEK